MSRMNERPVTLAEALGSSGGPRRGRPRSEKAREATLKAAMALLVDQGLNAMSMDAVARSAGVSKATIYRWWPSKERLALDALSTEWAESARIGDRDTGSLRSDLLAGFRPWVRQLRGKPYARVVAGLVAAAHADPEFAQLYRERFVLTRRETTRALLLRARDRREISANCDLEVVLDLLYGPIYHRLLHGHAELSDQFVIKVIDTVLAAISADTVRAHKVNADNQPPEPA